MNIINNIEKIIDKINMVYKIGKTILFIFFE